MTEGHLSHLQLDLNPPSLCLESVPFPCRVLSVSPFRKLKLSLRTRVISLSANATFILAFGGLFLGLCCVYARDSLPDARPSHVF